jgi:hypothetical protein
VLVWADDDVVVLHRTAGTDGRSGLGDLYVASRRHLPAGEGLREHEAEATARALWLTTCALRTELGADLVFCAGVDRSVTHFHRHLSARHAAAWPMAPQGDRAAVASLCERLGAHFPAAHAA